MSENLGYILKPYIGVSRTELMRGLQREINRESRISLRAKKKAQKKF